MEDPDKTCWENLLAAHPFGFFADPVTKRPLGEDEPIVHCDLLRDGRRVQLTAPVVFFDSLGRKWLAETGMVSDGLTAPRPFWGVQSPFCGRGREAFVPHDVICEKRQTDSKDAAWVFWAAMRALGKHRLLAWTRWFGVRFFGPQFKGPT